MNQGEIWLVDLEPTIGAESKPAEPNESLYFIFHIL